jgi:hypothetical protein
MLSAILPEPVIRNPIGSKKIAAYIVVQQLPKIERLAFAFQDHGCGRLEYDAVARRVTNAVNFPAFVPTWLIRNFPPAGLSFFQFRGLGG